MRIACFLCFLTMLCLPRFSWLCLLLAASACHNFSCVDLAAARGPDSVMVVKPRLHLCRARSSENRLLLLRGGEEVGGAARHRRAGFGRTGHKTRLGAFYTCFQPPGMVFFLYAAWV